MLITVINVCSGKLDRLFDSINASYFLYLAPKNVTWTASNTSIDLIKLLQLVFRNIQHFKCLQVLVSNQESIIRDKISVWLQIFFILHTRQRSLFIRDFVGSYCNLILLFQLDNVVEWKTSSFPYLLQSLRR